jgi:hypothetical protein
MRQVPRRVSRLEIWVSNTAEMQRATHQSQQIAPRVKLANQLKSGTETKKSPPASQRDQFEGGNAPTGFGQRGMPAEFRTAVNFVTGGLYGVVPGY